jgi:hypothetical protein
MKRRNYLLGILVFAIIAGSLYGGIFYEGNEYTESMMPYNYSGQTETFVVVSGTIDNYSSSKMSVFEINGVSMLGATTLPPPVDEKKYFIRLIGQNRNGSVSITGTNDWSAGDPGSGVDTTAITVPFSKAGVGRYYFYTADSIGRVVSSDMDTLTINDVDYTNQTVETLPERIDGQYYIYYSASNISASLDIEAPTADADVITYNGNDYSRVTMPDTLDGRPAVYIFVEGVVDHVSSNDMNTLEINGVDYTNTYSTTMPPAEDGKYFIYYNPKNWKSHFEIDGTNGSGELVLNIKVLLEGAL